MIFTNTLRNRSVPKRKNYQPRMVEAFVSMPTTGPEGVTFGWDEESLIGTFVASDFEVLENGAEKEVSSVVVDMENRTVDIAFSEITSQDNLVRLKPYSGPRTRDGGYISPVGLQLDI